MRPAYDMKPVYDEYAAMEYWPLEEAIKLVLDVDPEDDRLLIPHMLPALKKQNDDCGGGSDSLERLVHEKRNEIRADIRGLMGHLQRAKDQGQLTKDKDQGIWPDKEWPVQEDEYGCVNRKQFVRWVESKGVEIPRGLNRAMNARELPALGRGGGTRQKYNTALQDVINHIFRELKRSGKKGTIGDIRGWFISKRAIADTREPWSIESSWEPFSFGALAPNCDELYLDGKKLAWKDRDGIFCGIAFRSLEPYLKHARQTYELTERI